MTARTKAALLAVLTAAFLALAGPALAAKAAKPGADTAASTDTAALLTPAALDAGQKAVGKGHKATPEQALTAYWTADRMQAALDADSQPALDSAKAAQKDKAAKDAAKAREDAAKGAKPDPTGPAGKAEPQTPLAASPALLTARSRRTAAYQPGYAYWQFPARTAGKVFFTNASNGLNYVCSGTIVNSEGKDTVWTAGHCVHGGAGGTWHYNWVFVPSYQNGWAPYGYWSARQLWSMTNWMSSSEWASDMGAAVMNTNYGWRIVDYLGGQGITWNQSKYMYVTSFGYPAGYPFNGQTLWNCSGGTFPEWVFLWWSAETIGLPCDMTGGSSGGGWLAYFNGTTGYVNGHNDFKYNNDPNTMYSPYYDDTAANLYNAVRYL